MLKISSEHFQNILNEIDGGLGRVDSEVLRNTASRLSRAYSEWFAGYEINPESLLKTTFKSDSTEMILVKGIAFSSTCEHHMSPILGKVDVAYVPNKRVIGISKISRLVDCFAKRLQLQERFTHDIAETLMNSLTLAPLGVGVVTTGVHLCTSTRGVNKSGSETIVSAMRGIFFEDQKTRMEFLQLIK